MLLTESLAPSLGSPLATSLAIAFHDPALMFSVLIAVGVATQWLALRLGIPAILPLLLLGFAAGPLTGVLDPDAIFGDLLFPAVSMAVAVILFEGALTLRFVDLRGAEQVVVRLITLGVVVTILVVAWTTRQTLGFSWDLALLFGAIVCVSGPTVIIPMLRAVRPTDHVARILRWEGILIDPIGAVLAVVLFQAVLLDTELSHGEAVGSLLLTLAMGTAFGIAAGYGLGVILRRHMLPDYLSNVFTLGVVLLVNSLANFLAHEAGLVAVTAMGMMLANLRGVPTERLLDFKESLSVLLISVLFIVLAARLHVQSLLDVGPALIVILLVIVLVARPLSVLACTIGTETSWPERLLLAWFAPRGIIAAAISALFALRLQAAGLEQAGLLVGLTFSVIVVTVALQSLTARPLARLLGVAQPENRGVLIVGGNKAALAIARALQENGVKVLVADTAWAQIRAARMQGLPTFFGNAVSEHADRKMDLVGIGVLMALSHRSASNALACVHYRAEFGGGNVYTIRQDPSAQDKEVDAVAFRTRGHLLFKPEMTLEKIEAELTEGSKIRFTRLTEDFSFDDLLEKTGGTGRLLFAIRPGGTVRPFSEETSVRAGKGWRIGYLSAPERATTEAT